MTAVEEVENPNTIGSDIDIDSDEELQEAFAAGLIKPGLNTVVNAKKRVLTNNVNGLKAKLEELEKSFPWVERLDMLNNPAPLAPELANEELAHKVQREKILKLSKKKSSSNLEDDPIHNDFKREMLFYRQAQAAVLEAIPRLQSMGVPTRRPSDYFAQMLKSDQHMNRIREKLISKQVVEERIEKVKKLRELKKYGKQVQVEVQQKRQKEKREMLEEVKKFRKGKIDTLDFLEDNDGSQKSKKKTKKGSMSMDVKKKMKDKKFGFGGKKRGSKLNTKSSTNDFKPSSSKKKTGGSKKGAAAKRPGKSRRQKNKK